jgi:hypothetical protein
MTITESNRIQSLWSKSVVKVGRGGRGFVVETDREEKLIITVAHCVPRLPPPMTISHSFERTCRRHVGEIGKRVRPITVECLFVDPVADLAVLGPTDDDEAYGAFFEMVSPLPVGRVELSREPITLPSGAFLGASGSNSVLGPPRGECDAWLFSLSGEWFRCHVVAGSRAMTIASAADRIEGGMSGSPIVDENGKVIGVISSTVGAPQPHLARQLPGWLLEALSVG